MKDWVYEGIALLDHLQNCPVEMLEFDELIRGRLFTLRDYGFYVFIFKLSIHHYSPPPPPPSPPPPPNALGDGCSVPECLRVAAHTGFEPVYQP